MSARKTAAPSANQLAIEKAFPGVICRWVRIHEHPSRGFWLRVSVEASAGTLVGNGLTTQAIIDALPPCGYSSRHDLRRTSRGTFLLECSWMDGRLNGEPDEAVKKAAELGIDLGQRTARPKPKKRHHVRVIGSREVFYITEGPVIRVDWDMVRYQVTSRRAQLPGGAA